MKKNRIPGGENIIKQYLETGLWEDMNGDLHFSVPNILESIGLPNTPENCRLMQKELTALVKKLEPKTQIIVREQDPTKQ